MSDTLGKTPIYLAGGRLIAPHSAEFAEVMATAHTARERPRCMCRAGGIEMYVAKHAGAHDTYLLKRMPDTGNRHAPNCVSYEPSPIASGLGQVLGAAIKEDPATGDTTLKLDFALTRVTGRSAVPPSTGESGSATSSGARLSLRGLLHYLWAQAELTRWQPGFSGRRTWGAVRSLLLQATARKIAHGRSLRSCLYVPEIFFVEQRDAIDARRLALWSSAFASSGISQQLLLLIGEVKEIVPARYGYRAVLKHVPDQSFAIDDRLFHQVGRCFQDELTLWGAADDLHMVMIATFNVSTSGVATIAELSLMPVTQHWLPIESAFEKQLVEQLVREGRSFIKGLRYDLCADALSTCATLTDCGDLAPHLVVALGDDGERERTLELGDPSAPQWVWRPLSERIPTLPQRQDRREQS